MREKCHLGHPEDLVLLEMTDVFFTLGFPNFLDRGNLTGNMIVHKGRLFFELPNRQYAQVNSQIILGT